MSTVYPGHASEPGGLLILLLVQLSVLKFSVHWLLKGTTNIWVDKYDQFLAYYNACAKKNGTLLENSVLHVSP